MRKPSEISGNREAKKRDLKNKAGEWRDRRTKDAEDTNLKTIGGESVKMETEDKAKLTVEDIGTVVKNSGFKVDEKVVEAAVDMLETLSDFMTIEKKNGESGEQTLKRLEREGILTPAAAKEALKKLKTTHTAAGGVKYDESNRKSINFSKTAVNHVIRLLDAL